MMTIATKFFEPFGVKIDIQTGVMENPAHHKKTMTSSMKGYYANEQALQEILNNQNDPVHYEVFEMHVPEEAGHLIFGISKLAPGRVDDEFFFTKGHYHTMLETGETYYCISGEGYMLMKTPDGQCRWERFERGQMVYVPPCWAHRSVNTGNEPLVTLFTYQADAGHNYGDIVTEGFPKRVFLRNGHVVIE